METRIYEREKLYKEVWEEPMTTLSKRYGVSDVALRKQCVKMAIPIPKAGHWVKVKSGHKINVPPLPRYDGPNKVEVRINPNDAISRKLEDVLLFIPEDKRTKIKEFCLSLTVPSKLYKPHGLIKDTKQYYRSRKESTRPPLNRVINMKVSDEQMERTYRFYNTLFNTLEQLGYTIEIREPKYRGYYQRNEIFICLNEDSVPIFIKELQKRIENKQSEVRDSYGPTYEYIKTGKLHFGIDTYHAKRKNWKDTEMKKIEGQVGEIIIWVMEAIHLEKISREKYEIDEARRLEEQRTRQEIEERKEKELKRIELLNQNATDWEKAKRIRKFVDAVELEVAEIGKEDEEEINWMMWARDKADFLDPLVNKEDEVLGKGYSLISVIKDEEN